MTQKKAFEALDRTLRDIRNSNTLMGNITVLMSGDFRQTLPVVPKGTRVDELNASIKSSVLWHYVKTLKFSTNMRAQLSRDQSAKQFAEKLLELGEGKVVIDEEEYIKLNLICNLTDSIHDLVDKAFPNLSNYQNKEWI